MKPQLSPDSTCISGHMITTQSYRQHCEMSIGSQRLKVEHSFPIKIIHILKYWELFLLHLANKSSNNGRVKGTNFFRKEVLEKISS